MVHERSEYTACDGSKFSLRYSVRFDHFGRTEIIPAWFQQFKVCPYVVVPTSHTIPFLAGFTSISQIILYGFLRV